MHPNRRIAASGGLGLLLAALLIVPSLLPVRVAHAADVNWKPVSLIYTSDVKGKIDPCG